MVIVNPAVFWCVEQCSEVSEDSGAFVICRDVGDIRSFC